MEPLEAIVLGLEVNGVSHAHVAEAVGVSAKHLSEVLHRKKGMSLSKFIALLDCAGVQCCVVRKKKPPIA